MAKIKELGIVQEVHKSGIVETNKGVRSICKAKKGDRLIQDLDTKIISVAPKKTDVTTIDVAEYSDLDVAGLKEKFNIKELKAIAKQENRKGYSRLNEDEIASLIVFNEITTPVADTDGTDDKTPAGTNEESGDE